VALQLERLVRVRIDGIEDVGCQRVLIPFESGSFEGVSLDEAVRRCRDDARRFPENRTWILRVIAPT
jgi:hypothetical protein